MYNKNLLIVLFFFCGNFLFANSGLKLSNISLKEGLSNLNVSSVAEDRLGYIWVGTMRGLNRYNGAYFTHYIHNPKETNTLNSNHINTLLSATDGNIYIGTENGINIFNILSEKITNPFPELNNSAIKSLVENDGYIYIGSNRGVKRFRPENKELEDVGKEWKQGVVVNKLFFDRSGTLWGGCDYNAGLARYDSLKNSFDYFLTDIRTSQNLKNSIKSIYQVENDLMILCTKNGVSFFNPLTNQFVDPKDYSILERELQNVDIKFVFEKQPSVFWIGTYSSGIYVYDKSKGSMTRYFKNDIYSEVHSNTYLDYFVDKAGNAWLASFDAGLDVSFKHARAFNVDPFLNAITQNKFITGITKDNKSNLVIATTENGFFVYNANKKTNKNYNKTNSQLSYSYIRSIYADSRDHYWIGHHYGLQLFYPEKEMFKNLQVPEPNNGVVSILEMNGKIFAATDRHGVLVFDPEGNLLNIIKEMGSNIPKIIRLNNSNLLVCSFGNGLFKLNPNTYETNRIVIDTDFKGIDHTICILKASDSKIWLGTYNFGLFSLDLENNSVKNITINDGLPSNDVVGIEEDDDNNLWISTSYGLTRLNTKDFSLQAYFSNEGVNNYQFHEKSSFRDKDGVIYFGGNYGVTYFDPNDFNTNEGALPTVILENLYILNNRINPSEGNKLSQSLPYTKEITLTHKDKIFTIDYVGFDYVSSETMQYYCKLEGFDPDWYSVGNQRKVSYSNLSRGTFVFKVKARNGAGIWSENEAELIIHVKPSPWFSYWAWFIYILTLSGLARYFFQIRIKTILYKRELDFEQYEHQRERDINTMKQRFFSNISHEIRTPLTMISGMVGHLSKQDRLTPPIKEIAQSLEMSVDRLLKLINQLLAFKRLESDTLTLWLENECVNVVLQKIIRPYVLFAKEKNIKIEFLEENDYILFIDFDKLEKILGNLLSNAIKHTPEGGLIQIAVSKVSASSVNDLYPNLKVKSIHAVANFVEVKVTDNGSGIEEMYWDSIFDRYQTIDIGGKQKPDYSNSGIGLNFTKSLVELHKGSIRVKSKIGEGSTFAFILPFEPEIYEEKDFAVVKENVLIQEYDAQTTKNSPNAISQDFEKIILVAEDDPDLNHFLSSTLKEYYKVFSCFNGKDAFDRIKNEMPDVILADVMMPEMDGLELTRKIKNDAEYSHIPIILLTAKSEMSNQIEGLQIGADVYLPKPFNMDYLLVVIENQLKNRKRIQDLFLNGLMPNLNRSEINQLDLKFLARFNSLLEKEITNTDLDIAFLAKNLGMSRSSFYRKFMSLTSLSPISYIRKYRINKSIELMNSGNYSLREISDSIGFGSYSYFCTAFKQEQNTSPTEFIKRIKGSVEES